MKLRKLMGILPFKHLDTTENEIYSKIKYRRTYKLVNQPNYNKLKVNSLTSINAGISINKLISEFEKNNGEIKLDNCDLKIKLTVRNYTCKQVMKRIFKKFKI
jgi:hypothetical protein